MLVHANNQKTGAVDAPENNQRCASKQGKILLTIYGPERACMVPGKEKAEGEPENNDFVVVQRTTMKDI